MPAISAPVRAAVHVYRWMDWQVRRKPLSAP
jgi:hypothetical protein